jgi:hypothetical protein
MMMTAAAEIHEGGAGMLKMIDRGLGALLILGAVGHTLGSLKAYGRQPETLLWALSASLYIVLLGAVHLLRTARRGDHALAWIGVIGAMAQLIAAIAFGQVIGSPTDPRVIGFVVICAGLIGFGLKDALSKGTAP